MSAPILTSKYGLVYANSLFIKALARLKITPKYHVLVIVHETTC